MIEAISKRPGKRPCRPNAPRCISAQQHEGGSVAAGPAIQGEPSAAATNRPLLLRFARRPLAGTLAATLALVGLAGCTPTDTPQGDQATESIVVDIDGMDLEYTARDKDASYDEVEATRIDLEGTTAHVEGEGADVDGTTVTIAEPGTYVVSGTLSQGQLVIELPGEEDKAQVVLEGATVHNETGPALYVKQADKVFLTLAPNSQNHLSDGTDYALEDDTDEPYATLFSRGDLTINGSGALEVASSYRHGICSKDDLVITGGAITVSAPEDALRGRDCVKVLDGTFDLTAGEDAIKSNKDTDPTRGFVCLDGGTFAISAGDDAVHGETAVIANGGTVKVAQCVEGYEAQQVHVNGGDHVIVASDDAINASAMGGSAASGAEAGFDAATGGEPVPDEAAGGAPNGMMEGSEPPAMPEGEQASGAPDDQGAGATPAAPPEGVEPASEPNRQGDSASSIAEPQAGAFSDGRNQADQGAGPEGAAGNAMAVANEDCLVRITGGTVALDAGGDALDSNGSIEVTGGLVTASGPANSADAALDYEFSATIDGGTVLLAGPTGMAETFTGGTQPFALVQAQGQAGSIVVLADSDGAELARFEAVRAFQAVNVSAPDLAEGGTYQLIVDGTPTEFTASTTPSSTAGAPGGLQGRPAGDGGMLASGEEGIDDGKLAKPDGLEASPDGEGRQPDQRRERQG